MSEIRKFLGAWGAAFIAMVLAAKTAWELLTLVRSPGENLQENYLTIFIWFVLFFFASIVAIFQKEWELRSIKNRRPTIKVDDFGIHTKEWTNLPPTATAYVSFKNEPHSGALDAHAKDVYPNVIWEDENGKEITRNSGRWQIPNRNKPGRENLKTADLGANGEPKLFHFAVSTMQDKVIEALWRNDDDQLFLTPLMSSDSFKVTIVLTDSMNIRKKFTFKISIFRTNTPPFKALKLEKIGKWGKIEGCQGI